MTPDWIRQIRAIGWDLDGTLYPNHPGMKQKIIQLRTQRVAEKLGLDYQSAEAKFDQLKQQFGSNTRTLAAVGIDGKAFFSQMWDEMDLSLYIKPNPKVAELFESLKNYSHFLLSNANRLDQIKCKLDLIGLPINVFDAIVDTVKLGVFKPDPYVYQYGLDQLNTAEKSSIQPSQVLFVGDRIETDIKGAKAAGMKTCLVGDQNRKVDISIHSIFELSSILNSQIKDLTDLDDIREYKKSL